MARTDTLGNFLTDVADSIREKTGKSDSITPADFDTEIDSISGGGGSLTPIKLDYVNSGDLKEHSLYICNYNMSTTTIISSRIYITDTTFDGSHFDISSITSLSKCFGGSGDDGYSFTKIDLRTWNTSNVTNMGSMFGYNKLLTDVNVSNFDTSNVTSMSSMFTNCESLEKIDISSFTSINISSNSLMFANCTNLKALIINNSNLFNITNKSAIATSSIGTGTGYVYVPDSMVNNYKSATNWSMYASQIKGMSELPDEYK